MSVVFSLPSTVFNPGNFTSTNLVMPASFRVVAIQFNLTQAELADAAQGFVLQLWRLDQTSGQFVLDSGITWVGGAVDPETGVIDQPRFSVEVGPLASQTCRLQMTNQKKFTAGVTVTAA